MQLIQIGLVLALGFFTTWLANLWLGLFEDRFSAALITFGCFCLYAFIYDLLQVRQRRATSETTEHEQ